MNHPSPIILALDVSSREQATQWVRRLHGKIGLFKVGMQLFYQYGPDIVRAVQAEGGAVFLDLKLHDIPNTVAHACESLLGLGAEFITLHISGGPAMLQAAQAVVAGSNTRLLGITALTSLDQATLTTVYPDLKDTPAQWAVHLAGIAQQAGLFGIVCSAQENASIKKAWGNQLCLVNPGIRPAGADIQDQKRIMTPVSAMQSGANYLVIGRPILQSPNPEGTVEHILEEIGHAAGLSS